MLCPVVDTESSERSIVVISDAGSSIRRRRGRKQRDMEFLFCRQ